MKLTTLFLLVAITLFMGCSSDEETNNNKATSSSSIASNIADTPQPQIENEALRPPRVPSF